jgi:hypothetical protein
MVAHVAQRRREIGAEQIFLSSKKAKTVQLLSLWLRGGIAPTVTLAGYSSNVLFPSTV